MPHKSGQRWISVSITCSSPISCDRRAIGLVTVTRVVGEVMVFADIAVATIDHGYSEVNPVFPD
jgi:hypothetical protein